MGLSESHHSFFLSATKVLLEQPDEANPFRGRWEFPAVEPERGGFAGEALAHRPGERHRVHVAMGACLGHATHGILHRRLKLEVHAGTLRRGRTTESEALTWVALDGLDEQPVSGATRKVSRLATRVPARTSST